MFTMLYTDKNVNFEKYLFRKNDKKVENISYSVHVIAYIVQGISLDIASERTRQLSTCRLTEYKNTVYAIITQTRPARLPTPLSL